MDFDNPCECVGPVESWLNKLMDIMRSTVREQMTEGVVTYEEKPREQWIFDYPAQVVLMRCDVFVKLPLKAWPLCAVGNLVLISLRAVAGFSSRYADMVDD